MSKQHSAQLIGIVIRMVHKHRLYANLTPQKLIRKLINAHLHLPA